METNIRMGGYIEDYMNARYECKKTGKKINADINAALNIARRLGYRIRISRKIESYHVTHNGVKPLIPLQGANTQDPSIETPPLRAGRVSYRLYRGGSL